MIEQLQFSLRTAETPRLPSAWAYRIYGWLMAQLPADTAARLHEPVSYTHLRAHET
mgnify:CR=1 FL=1